MGRPLGSVNVKLCAYCGEAVPRRRFPSGCWESPCMYRRRKYCTLQCAGLGAMKAEPSRGAISKRLIRQRKPSCEGCGGLEQLGVHHKDENWRNNSPENLVTLCATCHTHLHWQEGKVMPVRSPPCRLCGKKSKGHGLCMKHYQRWRKWGDPTMVKLWNRAEPHSVEG